MGPLEKQQQVLLTVESSPQPSGRGGTTKSLCGNSPIRNSMNSFPRLHHWQPAHLQEAVAESFIIILTVPALCSVKHCSKHKGSPHFHLPAKAKWLGGKCVVSRNAEDAMSIMGAMCHWGHRSYETSRKTHSQL